MGTYIGMPSPGGRPAAPPSLPPAVDDSAAGPFSALFDNKNGFDLRTVEATAQLADRSIFVTSDGRRYRLESIDDSRNPNATTSPPPPAPPPQPSAPQPDARPSAAQSFGSLLRNSLRRRPTSTPKFPVSPGRSAHSPNNSYAPAASPISPAPADLTAQMAQLNVNPSRFSATPLYWESDGGVNAAEALTDPNTAPRSPSYSPPAYPTQPAPYSPAGYTPQQQPPPPQNVVNFDYVNYTHHIQQPQSRAATGGLPSLMELASPVASPRRESEYSPTDGPPLLLGDDEKEFYGGYYAGGAAQGEAMSIGPHANYVGIGQSYSGGDGYDTLTPVVVHPGLGHAPSHSSDGASTSRDNVLPGEQILFDGPVKSAQTLNAPVFMEGVLKVFRNTLSGDLRFHCKVGHESETYWIKAMNAQLVPVYAYDPRFPNVVHIRDNEGEKGNLYSQTGPGNGRPTGIYQFGKLKDLCDFQAKLTSEKVVLDITSVKLVKLSKDSRSNDTYYTVRLQMWHEDVLRKSPQSDVASFVTAGTALSGPLRERLVANSSRLIIYLGRLGEYITLFITDDIELKAEGPTMVRLKPRKASGFPPKGPRWPGIKAHIEQKGSFEMAGLDIHGQAPDPDIESRYELYKTFEIDFENSPSQDNFIRKWDEVMRERRVQRARVDEIRKQMGLNVFSGQVARKII